METPIIVDLGSYFIRYGFPSSNPKTQRCLVGVSRHPNTYPSDGKGNIMLFGNEAHGKAGRLNLTNPLHDGHITNFDYFEKLMQQLIKKWCKSFERKKTPSNARKVSLLLVISPQLLNKKEQILHMLYTSCNCHAIQLLSQPDVIHRDSKTRLIVDMGDQSCRVTPVINGLTGPTKILSLGSVNVIEQLRRELVVEYGNTNVETLRDCLHHDLHVAEDYEKQIEITKTSSRVVRRVTLPGADIDIQGYLQWRPTEIFYHPKIANSDEGGLHRLIYDSILRFDRKTQHLLLRHIFLTGGPAQIDGMRLRLQRELVLLSKFEYVNVTLESDIATWVAAVQLHECQKTQFVTYVEYKTQLSLALLVASRLHDCELSKDVIKIVFDILYP